MNKNGELKVKCNYLLMGVSIKNDKCISGSCIFTIKALNTLYSIQDNIDCRKFKIDWVNYLLFRKCVNEVINE